MKFSKLLPIQRFTIYENSMLPTLAPGDDILVFHWSRGGVGDIIVAQHRDKIIIKRINSIENGQYFLIGDNPNESTDSRRFGPISQKDIIGKVIYHAKK